MSRLEPGLTRTAIAAAAAAVPWDLYRRCPTCRAAIGAPCTSAATSIVEGERMGPPAVLAHPHGYRKRRTGRSIGNATA